MMEITNVSEACRLCLRGEGKISVFGNEVKSGIITAENIYNCVSVKITKDDKLPTEICESCQLSVENWCSFKLKCDRTQELLQGWLVQNNLGLEGNSITLDNDLRTNSCNVDNKPTSSTEPTISLQPASLSSSRSIIEELNQNNCPEDDKLSEAHQECKYENLSLSNIEEEKEHSTEISDSDMRILDSIDAKSLINEKPPAPDTHVPTSKADDEDDPQCVNLYDSSVNSNEDSLTSSNKAEESDNKISCKYNSTETDCISEQLVCDSNVKGGHGDFKSNSEENDEASFTKGAINPLVNVDLENKTENLPYSLDADGVELMEDCPDDDDSDSVQILFEGKESSFNDSENLKTDNSSVKAGDGIISCEEDEQIVEFTTAVTIDINPFTVGSGTEAPLLNSKNNVNSALEELPGSIPAQILVECEKEPDRSEDTNEVTSLPIEGREVVSSSVSPPVEKMDEKEGEVSSSVEKPSPTPETNQEETVNKSAENTEPPTDFGKESESFEPLITNIKEEPIDSTTDDTPLQPPLVRVKSEFSTLNFRNESNEDQSWENSDRRQSPQDDPNNSECFICNRKYSTVSNYRQHLLTKMHLFNSGQLVEPSPTKEPPKEIPPTFESPLLRSRLSNDPLNHPSYVQPSPPPPPPPATPPLKRKLVDHCRLCNTSFSYTSELRKHLLSKKHRLNVRLARYRGGPHSIEEFSGTQNFPQIVEDQQEPEIPAIQEVSKSIFICPIQNCHFSCVKGDNLLEHMKLHGIAQPIEKVEEPTPPKPKLSLRQQDLLKKEQELKLKKEAEIKIKREAEMKQFQEQQELIRQRMQGSYMSGSIMPFECEGCHKAFFRESGLKKHSWYCKALNRQRFNEEEDEEEDAEGDDDEGEESFLAENEDSGSSVSHCPLCDISFTARNVFINHIQIYHKGSYLESSIPKVSANAKKISQKTLARPPASKVQISSKLRVTNKTHGFSCDICGKKFNLLSSLNFHLRTHTVSVRHICRICKEPFNNRKAFMEHCRQHFLKPGSKETLCHKCFKVFKTRSELYHHRKNDQCSIKMKIYSCNFCEHSFKDPEALEEHKVRFHSESLDMADDTLHDSSFEELYDDSFIPLNPLSLLSQQNDNLPSTSSRMSSGYSKAPMSYNKRYSSPNVLNYSNTSAAAYSIKNSPNYSPSPSSMQPLLQCHVCKTNFSSKQALKKHTIMFHVMNKPYTGSKRYSTQRKGNIVQANMLKQWKCRHCKQAFRTRKVLVHHLKKCEYNSFEDMKGVCLQCGKWCESGKTRICQFCLPDLAKDPEFDQKRMFELSKMRRVEQLMSQNSQQSKAIKQEFPSDLEQQSHNSLLGNLPQKMPENIKKEVIPEPKEIPRPKGSKNNNPTSINDIHLMKCPIGNKYFRSEMIMVRHYSECDGSCENRCSHCRKLFNSPKEYKQHLLFSKCFGPRKNDKKKAKMRYPTFACKKKKVRRDIPTSSRLSEMDIRTKLLRQTSDKIPDSLSDVMEVSTYSEDNNSVGVESSSSSFSIVNRAIEEKSMKLGRICTVCNKVITMQRAVYRHAYCCFKTILLSQDSVTCPKCQKNFTKLVSMKENATGIKQHILDCHFVPYYVGQGIREDGSRMDTPPQYLCYICSFGFSSNESLMIHIKDHRHRKDEINNVVLQLEDELLSDQRMGDEKSIFSLHIKDVKTLESPPVLAGRVLSLQDSFPKANQPKLMSMKVYECDTCSRKFYNRKKYLRHKRVHGIISESVYKEAVESFVDMEGDNALSNN